MYPRRYIKYYVFLEFEILYIYSRTHSGMEGLQFSQAKLDLGRGVEAVLEELSA